jgi:hypothetical protein
MANDTRYRVNYGNGQVSDAGTLEQAKRELAQLTQYRAFAFIQVRIVGTADEPGDWFRYRGK